MRDNFQPRHNPQSMGRDRRVPICILNIELDRHNSEEVRVYEGEDPAMIVNQFGKKFNLTESAMVKMHHQIMEQIQINDRRGGSGH